MPQSATRTRKPATRRRAYKILGLALLLLTLALALPATASAFISTGDGATWSQGNSGSDDWFHGVDAKLSSPSSTSLAAGVVVAGAYGDSHPDASTYWAREGGAYDFGGLSAGSHRIELRDDANGAYAAQYRNNKPTFSSADNVAVTAGATTGTIAVTAPGGTGAWTVFGTSPGSFAVTGTAFTLNVTAPTGTSSYAAGTNLTVRWTTSSAVSTGQFGVWARSSAGGWYVGQLVPASGGASSYVTYLTLDVPIGSGYEAVVAWRAAAGSGAWTVFGTSPGSFAVTEFAAEGHVTGTVTNAGGVGLAGISVNAHRANASGTWDYVNGTSTAAGGAYDIGGLPTGTYRIRFYDNSGAYVGQCYDNKAMLSWADNVAVTAGATTPGINAVLAAGGHITGTVTNAAGAALAGITVVCNQPDGSGRWWGWSTDTDANGAYDFGAVSSGSHRIWFQDYSGAYAAQYYNNKPSFETADNVAVTAGATTSGINAVLAAGGRVTGTVTNAAGAGLAGIFVSAYRDDGSGGWYWVNRRPTAAGGAYNLGGLPAGTYRIEFEGSGAYARQYYNNKPTLSSGDDVVVTAGATTPGINATLIPPSALTVTGFTPTSGAAGTAVTINGSGFTGATRVTFNGTAATSFTVVSDTQITATVPTAATSGTIAVTTPNGTGVSAASFTVTGTAFTLNVTAPTGTSSYAAGTNLTVSWTTSSAASSGEFGVWARSSSGGWYIGKLVAASGGASYSTPLTLDVPAGGGYEAIVAWRAIPGSGAWTVFGTSPGSFAVTGTAFTLNVTAPAGTSTYAAGTNLTVSWTTSSAASSGEFGVWARSSSGSWYIGKLVAASGGASFGTALTLDVPAGSGYEAIVAWRAIPGSGAWTVFGTSPGSFAVTGTAFTLNVTAPTGTSSYAAGTNLTVSWTTSSAASSGEFGVWARSSSGSWYIGKLVAASGSSSYSTPLTLDVPVGSGYEAIVAWRAIPGSGAWTVFGTSPGSFAVTGTAFTLNVTAPTGTSSYAAGTNLTVSWTTSSAASSGEFGVWARSSSGSWYIGKLVAASGGSSYSTALTLDVPANSGYEAIVAWRAIPGSGAWTVFGTSPGSFAVTGLAADGHITGTVTNAAGVGLAGISVFCWGPDNPGSWSGRGSALTDVNGAYDFGGLNPASNYRISFYDGSGAYASQCYNNKWSFYWADDVAVTAGATTRVDAVLTLAGHVTGTVTNAAGAGVAGISLIAYRANGSGGWSALDAGAGHADSVVTAADGTYDLGRLPAGICRIMFVDGSGAYLEQYYNNKPTVSSADDVAVAAGATTPGVNAVLAVAGHVTGTVTNAAGAGLANIYVWASRANGSGGWGVVAGVDTAASGAYDLGGLPTGSYRIEFWDPAGSFGDQGAYATQYYNNKPTIASADNVAVTAGATTPGINAVLAVGGHVTGTVTNAGGAGLAGIRVYFYRANGSGGWDYVDVGYTVAAGALELGGLPAGTYRIWFRDDSGTYAGQYYNNKPTIASADDVAVTAGATTPGINAVLTPTLATTVTSFLPAFGPGGASGILTGTGFTGAPAVRFNGTAASYTVNSATQLTATVPAGATSGTIAVTAPNGTCTSPGSFTCPARVNSTEPYLYRAAIGGIETTYPWYWSSSESEYYQDVAWYQYFDDGNQLSSLKYGTPRVRAVRAF